MRRHRNFRKYGCEPFNVAVLHGGPGAPGEMTPVAKELSQTIGVIEPLQTANRLEGQIKELKEILEKNGTQPYILIGFSWGAMLGFIFASRFPFHVKKLILVSSGVFEEKYATTIIQNRLSRLSQKEREEAFSLLASLDTTTQDNKNESLARLGILFYKSDSFRPLTTQTKVPEIQYDVYRSVWKDAVELRRSGTLLQIGNKISCPVVALHGDFDPHPREGVEKPLSTILKDFRFFSLEHCGHRPWIEKNAREKFYKIIKDELR